MTHPTLLSIAPRDAHIKSVTAILKLGGQDIERFRIHADADDLALEAHIMFLNEKYNIPRETRRTVLQEMKMIRNSLQPVKKQVPTESGIAIVAEDNIPRPFRVVIYKDNKELERIIIGTDYTDEALQGVAECFCDNHGLTESEKAKIYKYLCWQVDARKHQ
jgi:hypothetical protein